jgi:hypothetical protein
MQLKGKEVRTIHPMHSIEKLLIKLENFLFFGSTGV